MYSREINKKAGVKFPLLLLLLRCNVLIEDLYHCIKYGLLIKRQRNVTLVAHYGITFKLVYVAGKGHARRLGSEICKLAHVKVAQYILAQRRIYDQHASRILRHLLPRGL